MKTFKNLLEENEPKKPVVVSFGRFQPPTTGHLKVVDKVREVAAKHKAKHTVIVSHTQDAKKNPLTSSQKIKHLKRYSPDTHFESSSEDMPTLLHHAARLHSAGHDHLIVVAGSDRVKDFHHLLHRYNGVKGRHGHYNFKKISVVSSGHRDADAEGEEGMSGTKMRQHAKNNDFSSFRQGVPSHVSDNHAKSLMHDIRKGMGLNESVDRGLFKAIFITGGPGSGKDVVIREGIASEKTVEMNFVQVLDILNSVHNRAMRSMNSLMDAVVNKGPLIINGPAEQYENIKSIKEQLESFGYDTIMIFVDTTNEESKNRNSSHKRMMMESVRLDKWKSAQNNKKYFTDMFENYLCFDNTGSIQEKEEDVDTIYNVINNFLDYKTINENSIEWLENHGKLSLNEKFNVIFKEEKNVKRDSKNIQKSTITKYNPDFRAARPGDITPDNETANKKPGGDEIRGNQSPRKNPNGETTAGGAWHSAYQESAPHISVRPIPKESNFSQDKDKIKRKKFGDKSVSGARVGRPPGIGQEYDTRAGGQGAAAGAGLGDQTYSESQDYSSASPSSAALPGGSVQPNPLSNAYDPPPKKSFKKFRLKSEAIDDPGAVDMGVGGTMSGAGNKEPLQTPYDNKVQTSGILIRKKKKADVKL